MASEPNKKAGLLELQVNLSEIDGLQDFTRSSHAKPRDLLDKLETLGGNLKTMLPTVATRVQSIVEAVATTVPSEISEAKAELLSMIPRNCSLGTQEFCVGYTAGQSCGGLPPRFSDLLPPVLEDVLPDFLNVTHLVDKALSAAQSEAVIQAPLVLSLFLLMIPIVNLVVSYYGWPAQLASPTKSGQFCKVIAVWLSSLLGLALLSAPLILTSVLSSKLDELPKWITVKTGKASGIFVGSVVCAAISLVTNQTLWARSADQRKAGIMA